jgi:hypothetical protein
MPLSLLQPREQRVLFFTRAASLAGPSVKLPNEPSPKNGQSMAALRVRSHCRHSGSRPDSHRRHLPELRPSPGRPSTAPPTQSVTCESSKCSTAIGARDALPLVPVMLRICYSQRWTLCGQLAGPWVQELRSCWQHARRVTAGSAAMVDLSDVTFIDENGESLLSEMRSAGVQFVATGVETKHLLQNLKGRGERALRRSIKKIDSPCRSGGSSFDSTVEEDARLAGEIPKTPIVE